MNQNLEPTARAAVVSLRGQVNALTGIIGGPLLGALALTHTTRSALLVAALVLVPTPLLYLLTVRRSTPLVATTAPDGLPPMSDL